MESLVMQRKQGPGMVAQGKQSMTALLVMVMMSK